MIETNRMLLIGLLAMLLLISPASSASITSLSSSTLCHAIEWTWVNPGGDHDHLSIWRNGVFLKNVTSTVTSDYWTNLTESASYTFSSRATDSSGNTDTTWVNSTVFTSSCPSWPKIMMMADDGYDSHYSAMYPILNTYGYPATSYIITGEVGNPGYMSVSEMNTLYNAGWDLGNHCSEHLNLIYLDPSDQERIVREGRDALDGWGFSRSSHHLAYPGGGYNDQVVTSAANTGMLTGRNTEAGYVEIPRSDLLRIPVTSYLLDSITVSDVENTIAAGGTYNTVVILLHHISDTPGTYNWSIADLAEVTNYIHDHGYDMITISQWYSLNGGAPVLPPVANFISDVQTGTAPLPVQFTDQSTNTPTSWKWEYRTNAGSWTEFGSGARNPSYTFGAGTYDIRLTVTNDGGSNMMTRVAYVSVTSGSGTIGTIGIYRNGVFYLRNSNTGGVADTSFGYGQAGDIPVVGDWTNSGTDTIGVYRNGIFYLRNSNTGGVADTSFGYGQAGDIPVVGDWTNSGTDTIGVYRNGIFYLRNSNTGGVADNTFIYGQAGDIPVVGDWTGSGTDTIGVYRNGVFYLRNSNTGGVADNTFIYGQAGDIPVVWHHDGMDTIGVYRSGTVYLRNTNTGGIADNIFVYGQNGDKPVNGVWN